MKYRFVQLKRFNHLKLKLKYIKQIRKVIMYKLILIRLVGGEKVLEGEKEKIIIILLSLVLIGFLKPLIIQEHVDDERDDVSIINNPQPTYEDEPPFVATFDNIDQITTIEEIKKYLFTIDPTAYATIDDFPIEKLANMDLSLDFQTLEPRILIMHTHSQEWFIDSKIGNPYDSIVGVGQYLAEILVNRYGVSVVHDVGMYDIKDGNMQRSASYEEMEPAVKQILEKYPTIEVIIDLHRDGVPDDVHLVTEINGKPTAQIMFFNGITRYNDNGTPVEMPELVNPYIKENLSLTLQLFLTANENYPRLARRNYIKAYRYSLHLKPRSILVEVGANTNTVEEAKNAMYPLASIIMQVLRQ